MIDWLPVIGLCVGLAGAAFLAYGLIITKHGAIELGVSRWSGGGPEEVLRLPKVRDRLRQSRNAIMGLALLAAGFVCQILVVWPGSATDRSAASTTGQAAAAFAARIPDLLIGSGLVLGFLAALVVLPGIFITDDEISRLSSLPFLRSGTHLTPSDSNEASPVALVDVDALERYRSQYLDARKAERLRGKRGLKLLTAAFGLQLVGLIVRTASA